MNTKEKIAIMQACVDGKTIEYRMHGQKWLPYRGSDPTWNWDNFEYRIKPEPRVIYVNEYERGGEIRVIAYKTDAAARSGAGSDAEAVAVKYIRASDVGL